MQLVVVHDHRQRPMPFVDEDQLHKTAQHLNFSEAEMQNRAAIERPVQSGLLLPKNVFASLAARHGSDEILDVICKTHPDINVAVNDLTGLDVVAAHEFARLGTLTTLGHYPEKPLPDVPSRPQARAAWLCREACQYEAVVSGYKSRHIQMQAHSFDWLGDYLDTARDRLVEQFGGAGRSGFEVEFREPQLRVAVEPGSKKTQATCLSGRVDIVWYNHSMAVLSQDDEVNKTFPKWMRKKKVRKSAATARPGDGEVISIWEIKLVAKLLLEHAVQACIYAHLWALQRQRGQQGDVSPLPHIILFNVRDGESWEIVPKSGAMSLRNVVEEVLRAKYSTRGTSTTDDFLRKSAKTNAEVEGYWKGSQ
ncbi:hypothetical protein J7T55_008967 [Diaporthe amygdali]|uniref:uncharacterized protein n=1 Tax=Phomopsis amygdali TaxID=1214568 RepID=UPI0022FE57A2|nr:uncharacterized protein J7T55_008967 [Diaporthe amygdali]KAJ0100658.1 hypothetical protein J7T55_008967 [Diaporthe amygdali]